MSDKPKELIFEEEAREFLRKGIKELTDVVGVTLGPKGRYVGLDTGWGSPQITNDASGIVKDIELKNQYANMGASIGKEMAAKMKETCGDGTATSILLLGSLVDNGVKNIASGASPILVKRGMEKAAAAIVTELEKKATAVNAIEELADAQEVGKMIADAFKKVGKEGVISIEESQGVETSIEMVEGMQIDRGYLSSYFSTSKEKMVCELSNPRILITDAKISGVQDILPLLQAIAAAGQELLIIADDLEGDALSTLVINKIRGLLKVCAIKAPGFGDRRKALLEDLAILTGATLASEETGNSLKEVDTMMLGSAEKVTISKDSTTIINGGGDAQLIQKRIKQIQAEAEKSTNSYDTTKLEERKAKLSGGVAVIKVGAPTEAELKQRKRLFEDTLNSIRCAIEEGVVVGGGIALLRSSKTVEKELKLSKEEEVGARIVFEACLAPFKKLMANSGYDGSVFLEEILKGKETIGFNVESGKVEDLVKAGIRDPLKMVKNGLKFAVSSAGVILLSECLIGEITEEKN